MENRGTINHNLATGRAGELRVMSELLLRGFRIAQELVDDGVDIRLNNGKTIQVKTVFNKRKGKNNWDVARVTVAKTRRDFSIDGTTKIKRKTYDGIADFIVIFYVKKQAFFIIPTGAIKVKYCLSFSPNSKNGYYRFRNRWDLLI